MVTVHGQPGFVSLDESFKTMEQCVAEMHRQTYVLPDDQVKRFACIKITEMKRPY